MKLETTTTDETMTDEEKKAAARDASEIARLMKEAVKAAKARAGAGWTILGPELQQALVRSEVLRILGMWASFEKTLAGKLAMAGVRWDNEPEPMERTK